MNSENKTIAAYRGKLLLSMTKQELIDIISEMNESHEKEIEEHKNRYYDLLLAMKETNFFGAPFYAGMLCSALVILILVYSFVRIGLLK